MNHNTTMILWTSKSSEIFIRQEDENISKCDHFAFRMMNRYMYLNTKEKQVLQKLWHKPTDTMDISTIPT